MAVIDYIKPLEHHTSGLPPMVMFYMRQLNPGLDLDRKFIDLTQEAYEKILRFIEQGLHGDVPVNSEEKAAEAVSHLILDAAFVHDRLCAAGVVVGAFPYDYLAEKLLPKKKDEDADA